MNIKPHKTGWRCQLPGEKEWRRFGPATFTAGNAQKVEDSTLCDVASADYLLTFRKKGENRVPVSHPTGLHSRCVIGDCQRPRPW